MSLVFAARHPQLEPRVAVKILRREVSTDKQYADRFLEDARSAASLNHPNIVGVKDFDTADGVPFIVMELVDGWSLEQWLPYSTVQHAIGRLTAEAGLQAVTLHSLRHRVITDIANHAPNLRVRDGGQRSQVRCSVHDLRPCRA